MLYEFSADQSGVILARGSPDYAQRARHRTELHFLDLAHVLAIKLECDGPVAVSWMAAEVVAGRRHSARAAARVRSREHLAQDSQRADRAQAAKPKQVEAGVEARRADWR